MMEWNTHEKSQSYTHYHLITHISLNYEKNVQSEKKANTVDS